MAGIPEQRHRCPRHEWCVERLRGHHTHVGDQQILTTSRGTEIRVSLSAEGDATPVVQMEATFERGGPAMELAELEAAEAVELAGSLLGQARVAELDRNKVR